MTLDLRNIWTSTNRLLTTINLYLFAFIWSGMARPVRVKSPDEVKIPLGYNIVLLFVLSAIVFLLVSFLFVDK